MRRKCPKCQKRKNRKSFTKNKSTRDGLDAICRLCRKLRKKATSEQKAKSKERWRTVYKGKYKYKRPRSYFREADRRFIKKRKKDLELGPIFVMYKSIQQGIYRAMRLIKDNTIYEKQNRSLVTLGLNSWQDFRIYIESLFEEGMNWKNYGRCRECWSIDHKIPISSAKNIEDISTLNHHTNLQPMWHLDNIRKGGASRVSL